jgi:hypothetical protein
VVEAEVPLAYLVIFGIREAAVCTEEVVAETDVELQEEDHQMAELPVAHQGVI